ncbi:MAG TPA: sigma-70 family RNA polymerase sigma factor [Polyangiales bacterium]
MAIDIEAAYVRFAPMVYRRCRRLLGADALAEEAMQDVFVRLLGHRETLDDRGMSSLLFQMATQVSLNRLRSRGRRPESSEESVLHTIACADDTEGQGVARAALARILGQESPSTRWIATLHFVDAMTLEEVATEVGLSVSGVRKRLRGLRERLVALEPSHG